MFCSSATIIIRKQDGCYCVCDSKMMLFIYFLYGNCFESNQALSILHFAFCILPMSALLGPDPIILNEAIVMCFIFQI